MSVDFMHVVMNVLCELSLSLSLIQVTRKIMILSLIIVDWKSSLVTTASRICASRLTPLVDHHVWCTASCCSMHVRWTATFGLLSRGIEHSVRYLWTLTVVYRCNLLLVCTTV
jgi:hypothetical protein